VRVVIGVLVAGLLVGCSSSGSSPTPTTPPGVPPPSATQRPPTSDVRGLAAVQLGSQVLTEGITVPGFTGHGTERRLVESPVRPCAGKASKSVAVLAPPTMRQGGDGKAKLVSIFVDVTRDPSAAAADVAALTASDSRSCLEARLAALGADMTGQADLTRKSLTPLHEETPLNADGMVAVRLTASGQDKPVYVDLRFATVRQVELGVVTVGVGAPFPARTGKALLGTLLHNARSATL
jgi:hypothetical protein